MSNLNKYIQNINEEDLKGNKGEKYEKLISLALNYLILKTKKEKIEVTIEKLNKNPKEIKELERLSVLLNKEILEINKLQKTGKDIDFTTINNIFDDINNTIGTKKLDDDTKIVFLKAKSISVLNRRKQLLEALLGKSRDKNYLEKLKKSFKKEGYQEFIKIDTNVTPYQPEYEVAYKIAKNIIKKYKTKGETIVRVANIGSKNGKTTDYWQNLFSNKIKSSTVKTDIIIETKNAKSYNLSLKMKKNRLGTPRYIDIYTLILHAINILFDKNKDSFISKLKNNAKKAKKEKEVNFLEIKKDKLKQIKNKLTEILEIDEKATDAYITIINISLMIDLLFKKYISKINPTPLEVNKALIKFVENEQFIVNAFNELKALTITTDDIEQITTKKGDMQKAFDSLVKEKQNKMEATIKSFNTIKLSILTRDNLEDLIAQFIKKSESKYFGHSNKIDSNIEKLIQFFNDNSKKSKYIDALNLRSVAKKATYELNRLFKNEEEIFKEILGNDDFKIVKKFLNDNKNKNFIKKEIIKEALTGQAKFIIKKYIATHVLTYDDKTPHKVDIEEINDKYIDKVSEQVKIEFGFKGDDDSSVNVMHINSESFFGDIKDKIGDIFDNVKLKALKIISSVKKKSLRLLNLFGIKIKINKATMPQWIIDKL
jgi:hypothetical protein